MTHIKTAKALIGEADLLHRARMLSNFSQTDDVAKKRLDQMIQARMLILLAKFEDILEASARQDADKLGSLSQD